MRSWFVGLALLGLLVAMPAAVAVPAHLGAEGPEDVTDARSCVTQGQTIQRAVPDVDVEYCVQMIQNIIDEVTQDSVPSA